MGYIEDGYKIEKGLFDPEQIRIVKKEMDGVFQRYAKKMHPEINAKGDKLLIELYEKDFEGFCGCGHACQSLIHLHYLAGSVDLHHLGLKVPAFNTKPLVSFSSPYTAKNKSYWKIPAHQDWPSNLGSINGVTCWVPLVDITDELGPLEIAPKSHKLGPLEPVDRDGIPCVEGDFEFIKVPLVVGDAVFFNTMTVHRSGNNVSDKIRWSMHFRYNDLNEESFIERKYPRNRTND